MFPMAITTGNTFVMKPSEVDPGCPMRLCELAVEAGVPAGVLNVIHGTHVNILFSILIFLDSLYLFYFFRML